MALLNAQSDDLDILEFFHDVADAAADALDEVGDWSLSGVRTGQYKADVLVDNAVTRLLERAGVGILSEESGARGFQWPLRGDELIVIVDPIDGSTNASKGIPWFATALCAVDSEGPRVSLIAEQSGSETRFSAVRGSGAVCDGVRIASSSNADMDQAVIGVSGVPPSQAGWWQFRALGAAALDLCLVATGALDGYIDFHDHGVWDYAASLLICEEAGIMVVDAFGRDLLVGDPALRRTPIAGYSPEIVDALVALRVAHGE